MKWPQRYHVPDPDNSGLFTAYYWLPCNTSVFDDQGRFQPIIHSTVHITEK